MKITLDTNVWLSAIFWEGEANKLIEKAEQNNFEIIITKEILSEIIEVLNRESKFQKFIEDRKQNIEELTRTILSIAPFQGNTGNFEFSVPLTSLKFDGTVLTNGNMDVRSQGSSRRTQVAEKVFFELFESKFSGDNLIPKVLELEFQSEALANIYIAEQNNWLTASANGATILAPLNAAGCLYTLVYVTLTS